LQIKWDYKKKFVGTESAASGMLQILTREMIMTMMMIKMMETRSRHNLSYSVTRKLPDQRWSHKLKADRREQGNLKKKKKKKKNAPVPLLPP
jgi:hypothetical protein